jgi:hypothetical protein
MMNRNVTQKLIEAHWVEGQMPCITDQIHCYDSSGYQIPCAKTGQDANHKDTEKLSLLFRDRFQSRGDVVHDSLTGHGWLRDANSAGFPLSWKEANNFIAEMNKDAFGGFSRWRLPDRSALFSLVSHQCVNPSLPLQHPFKNVFPGYYWTSDTCSRLQDQAWYVHLGGGRVFRGMKHGSYLTWPVIPGIQQDTIEDKRFFPCPPLVHDHLNKMTWLMDHPSLRNPISWEDALEGIKTINREKPIGCNRWHLPNIRELECLVDITTNSPAIFHDINLKDIKVQPGYWSSTTSVYEPSYAWVLYAGDGEVGVGLKQKADFYALALTEGLIK